MKFFLPFLLCGLFCACTGGSSDGLTPASELESTADFAGSPDQDTASYQPLYIHPIPPAEEINNNVTSVGGFGQVITPPANDPTTFLMTSGYWMIAGYADYKSSTAQRIAATGMWIRCFPNGTFFGGHWDRQTHAGAWYLDNTSGKHPRVTLDSNVDRQDAIWEIQGSDNTEFVSVRLNDPSFGHKHHAFSAKWMRLDDMPTKKQFADFHGPGTIQ